MLITFPIAAATSTSPQAVSAGPSQASVVFGGRTPRLDNTSTARYAARSHLLFIGMYLAINCPGGPDDSLDVAFLSAHDISDLDGQVELIWRGRLPDCRDRDRAEVVQQFDLPGSDDTGHPLVQPLVHPLDHHHCLDPIEAAAKCHDAVSASTGYRPLARRRAYGPHRLRRANQYRYRRSTRWRPDRLSSLDRSQRPQGRSTSMHEKEAGLAGAARSYGPKRSFISSRSRSNS